MFSIGGSIFKYAALWTAVWITSKPVTNFPSKQHLPLRLPTLSLWISSSKNYFIQVGSFTSDIRVRLFPVLIIISYFINSLPLCMHPDELANCKGIYQLNHYLVLICMKNISCWYLRTIEYNICSVLLILGSKTMQCPLWLVILPTAILAVPLSDFFDYNRTGSICISSRNSANDDLSRSDCDTIVFPKGTNYEVLYNVNTAFPFFNETVTTINVSKYAISIVIQVKLIICIFRQT